MTIEFNPLCEALGAEVIGVDLTDDHSDAEIAEIRKGWLRHKILLFRGQDLNPEHHMAFAQRFGTLYSSPLNSRAWIPEYPDVIVFSNIKSTARTSAHGRTAALATPGIVTSPIWPNPLGDRSFSPRKYPRAVATTPGMPT